jgi:hypothetical protein
LTYLEGIDEVLEYEGVRSEKERKRWATKGNKK